MKAKSIREVYANRSPTASTSRIAPPAKKQKLAQHVPEQPPKPKPRARGTAGLAKRKGLETSDEADSEQSGAILKSKGKGKAATVEEVEDESDIPPRTDPKGKGRAATVEDVEDEYDSLTASSVQSEGESWDENDNGMFPRRGDPNLYADVMKLQCPLLDLFASFGHLRGSSVEFSWYVVAPY